MPGRTGFIYTPELAGHAAAGTLPLVHFYTPLLLALLDLGAVVRERQGKLLWLNRVYIYATPSTGLVGSAPDMARLMLAYLDHGILDGKRILAPESAAMLTETAPLDGHGLVWSVGKYHGSRFLEHAGGGPGFATILRPYPGGRLGLAILAIGTDLDRQGLMHLVADLDWRQKKSTVQPD